MKTRAIVHRSHFRGTLITLAALTAIAYLLPARADAGVRVVAQVGPVAVDYRDRGPGCDAQAQARILLDPVAARVYVGRQCGNDHPDCLVRVMERCGRHDRDRDGRCDKCERRDRHGKGRDRHYDDRHDDCDDDRRRVASGRTDRDGRCEHSDRCDACGYIEVGSCRDHRGLAWVPGHYESRGGRPGRGNQVWLAGHWERLEVAYR
jgi:hypothetical protein